MHLRSKLPKPKGASKQYVKAFKAREYLRTARVVLHAPLRSQFVQIFEMRTFTNLQLTFFQTWRSTQRTIESTQRFEFPGAPMDFSKLATAGCGELSTAVDVEFADLAKLRPKQCYQHHIVVCMTARSITIVDVGMQCLGKFHLAIFKFHDVRDLLGLTALLCSPSLHRFCTLGKMSREEIL